jgi:hypothetical protein
VTIAIVEINFRFKIPINIEYLLYITPSMQQIRHAYRQICNLLLYYQCELMQSYYVLKIQDFLFRIYFPFLCFRFSFLYSFTNCIMFVYIFNYMYSCIKLVLLDGTLHEKSSKEPSLQHFQFCSFGRS